MIRKVTLLTGLVLTASLTALAQGRITAQNGNSLVVFATNPYFLIPADAALAGQPIPVTGPLPSGISLLFGIYAGTSSTSLSLVSSIPINPVGGSGSTVPGQIVAGHVVLPFAGGSLAYFQVKIWDSAFASYDAALSNHAVGYLGTGSIFTMTPGTFAYPGIDVGGGTTYQNVPYVLGYVPEPSTLPLVGLGSAALLIFRRRK